MDVSVILPTRDRREMVLQAIQSVLEQTIPGAEILVVDNGSTDGTREALTGLEGRIRYLFEPVPGISRAGHGSVRWWR